MSVTGEPETSARRVPKQARSRQTVASILDALPRLYETNQPGSITAAQLAKEASVAAGTLYRFFPSVEAAEVACAGRLMAESDHLFLKLLEEAQNEHWRTTNSRLIDAIVRQLTDDKTSRDLFRTIHYTEAFQKASIQSRRIFLNRFTEFLVDRGLFTEEADLELITTVLVETGNAFQRLILFSESKDRMSDYIREWKTFSEHFIQSKL